MKINPLIAVGLILALTAYVTLSESDDIVVSEKAEINGLLGKLREKAQGERFWERQLSLVNSRIHVEENFPSKMADVKKRLNNILEESRNSMEQFYNENPKLKRSESQKLVESLRRQADEIERGERNAIIEEYRLKRIEHLKSTKKAIMKVLDGNNP